MKTGISKFPFFYHYSTGDVSDIPTEFRKLYIVELNNINLSAARTLALCAAIVYILFYFTGLDHLVYPHKVSFFLIIRLIVSSFCIVIFLISKFKLFEKSGAILSSAVIIACGFGISMMIRKLGYDSTYYAGFNIVYLATVIIPSPVHICLFACFSVFTSYLLPIFIFDMDHLDLKSFINNTQFQFFTIILASVISHFQFSIRRREIINRLTITKQAEELEERDKYKREFISNITHELKTPLSIVIGNVDLILETLGEQQPEIMDQARQVQQAAFQLANHVDRIIAVSNIDDPAVKLDLQNYNYCGVVQNIFSIFLHKAQQEKLAYTLNCPDKPLVVNVDIVRIEEVLTNLVQNAFKFTDEGGSVTVAVATDGQQVLTEVADTGVGISKEKQANIFDRLFQADGALSKRHGGMGLGLYIVKKNIEMLGGTVEVDSCEGKGTSFRFTLPLYIDQTVPVKNEPYTGHERRQTQRRSGRDRRADERRRMFEYQQSMGLDDLAKMSFTGNIDMFEGMNPSQPTILIVEDNPGMMKVVIEALRHDYNLLLGRDAFEALDKLNRHSGKVSLILSDIMMPGMSGFDFCVKVMEKEECRSIPLIFVTALMSEEDQLRGFGLGATDYITKPYNMKILKEKVDHWISRRRYETILKDMSQELEARVQQASRVKDIIFHEIRNPMAVISAADSLIAMVKEKNGAAMNDPKIDKYLESLRQGVESLNSVLETTRQLDIGAMAVRKPESLETIISEAVLQTRHLMGDSRLTMHIDSVRDIIVKADRRMLVQVLINVIRNAAEAITEKNPPEGGTVIIACTRSGHGQIALKISDNGIGMDEDVRENLFRFKYTTKRDGTGIGLHLSNLLIKLHEGSMRVESTRGAGSHFIIYLPVS